MHRGDIYSRGVHYIIDETARKFALCGGRGWRGTDVNYKASFIVGQNSTHKVLRDIDTLTRRSISETRELVTVTSILPLKDIYGSDYFATLVSAGT